jgi:hypothetical protein
VAGNDVLVICSWPMTTGEHERSMTMRDYFHELYGDDPFDDERRVVPGGGSLRSPRPFTL